MRATRMRPRHRVEVWMSRPEYETLDNYSRQTNRSMRDIVRDWLSPHIAGAVAGDDLAGLAVPRKIPDRVKMFVYMTPDEYRAVRWAASRVPASRNRLLYAWIRPRLERISGR